MTHGTDRVPVKHDFSILKKEKIVMSVIVVNSLG